MGRMVEEFAETDAPEMALKAISTAEAVDEERECTGEEERI